MFARRVTRCHSQFGIIEVQLRHRRIGHSGIRSKPTERIPGQAFDVQPFQQQMSLFRPAVRPYTDALQLFGVIAALAAFLVIGEALWRAVRVDASDTRYSRARRATHSERGAVAFARVMVATIAGAALAVLIGWLLSPLFPLGIVRPVEPNPGLRFDLPVALIGFFGIVVPLALVGAVAAWADEPGAPQRNERSRSRAVLRRWHRRAPARR